MASVNRPTDVATRDRDINQKLQLYGIFTAFSNGKVPSNKQIDVALNSFLATRPIAKPAPKLSEEGHHLMADLRNVVEQAKYLLLIKNEGNLLQDFIWQTQQITGGSAQVPGAPVNKDTAKQHASEALDGLRTLGTLLISNGQFRKLLNDASILLRDMAGDAASKAANKINPSESELNQIDDAAEENTWHDVPDMSRDNIRGQMKDQYKKNKPVDRNQLQDMGKNAMNAADQQRNENGQPDAGAAAEHGRNQMRDAASQNMPDESKEQVEDVKNRTNNVAQSGKGYLSKKLPQERRDQTIHRLKKMIVEIQGHSDYQQAIETLLSLAEEYSGHSRNLAQAGAGNVKGARGDSSLQNAETDLKTLIERFANSTSLDDLFDSINQIYRDADRDPELKNWFKSMDRFVRKCLQEQGFILKDSSTDEWNQLNDKGRFLLRERYRNHTDRIVDEFKFLGDQFDQDPQNKAFADAMQKLFNDLGKDANGQPAFKPHLITDLTEVIIPEMFENIRYVPIPRIEVSDPMIDAVIENLVIESDNLTPNVLEFGTDNFFRWGRKSIKSRKDHKIMISASGIQMDLKDVSYYIKKKQGFPSITDKGVMDIFLGGEGLSFKLAASNAQAKDRANFFKVDNVTVNLKNVNIKIKQSNHKLLFSLAKTIVLKVMRPVIMKAVEKVIRDNFGKADAFAYDIYQEYQRGVEVAKKNPEQAQNVYQNYLSAIQKTIMQKKEKAQEKSSNTTVNVAMTKQDSIFKNISLPGGISTKATEYKELAQKGEQWESPVFGIGSAKESSNLSRLKPVSRKPHNATEGKVRGDNHPGSGNEGNFSGESNVNSGYDQASEYGQTRTGGYGDEYRTGQTGGSGFTTQVNQAFDLPQRTAGQGAGQSSHPGGTTFYSSVTK